MKCRILNDQTIDGLQYRANQVVDLPADVAKAMAKDGMVDPDKGAVAYCIDELGVTVLVHESEADRAAKQALFDAEKAVERITAALAAETEASQRAALEADLKAAQEAVIAAAAAAAPR